MGKMEFLLIDLENIVGGVSLWRENQEFTLNMLIITSNWRCMTITSKWVIIQVTELDEITRER